MSIYKKINRETGEEASSYIVYEGSGIKLNGELTALLATKGNESESYEDIRVHVNSSQEDGVYITLSDVSLSTVWFNAHIHANKTLLVMLYKEYYEGDYYSFPKSRAYTPEELEELYPSEYYDTVEVIE